MDLIKSPSSAYFSCYSNLSWLSKLVLEEDTAEWHNFVRTTMMLLYGQEATTMDL